MIEGIIMGLIQGIAEWLPISSEGLLVLADIHLFGSTSVSESISLAVFLHLGTFAAALCYFWRDVVRLVRAGISWKDASIAERKLIQFLAIATLVSALLGGLFLVLIDTWENFFLLSGKVATFGIGGMLLITGLIMLQRKAHIERELSSMSVTDALLLGAAQGSAAIPGISRSGITVSGLLLRGFGDATALRVSFLMSLPIVLLGNIFLNVNNLSFSIEAVLGLVVAFVAGLSTIHVLLTFARKVSFSRFVIVFALLLIFSVFF